MTNPSSPSIDKSTIRKMVMDSIICQTADDFLDRWQDTIANNFTLFQGINPEAEGNKLLQQIRQICVQLDKGEAPTSPEAAKPKRTPKAVQVVIFEGGEPKVSKGFDRWNDAEGWAARRIVDLPGSHATVNGKMMDRDMANARIYGIRRAGPSMKTSTTGSGPWQKAQQSKASFSKG